jgi:hypothetical protein
MRGGRSIHTISGNWQARDNEPSALDRFHEDRAHIDGYCLPGAGWKIISSHAPTAE